MVTFFRENMFQMGWFNQQLALFEKGSNKFSWWRNTAVRGARLVALSGRVSPSPRLPSWPNVRYGMFFFFRAPPKTLAFSKDKKPQQLWLGRIEVYWLTSPQGAFPTFVFVFFGVSNGHQSPKLGGGFKYVLFTPLSDLGKIPILTNIFQMGLKPPTRKSSQKNPPGGFFFSIRKSFGKVSLMRYPSAFPRFPPKILPVDP